MAQSSGFFKRLFRTRHSADGTGAGFVLKWFRHVSSPKPGRIPRDAEIFRGVEETEEQKHDEVPAVQEEPQSEANTSNHNLSNVYRPSHLEVYLMSHMSRIEKLLDLIRKEMILTELYDSDSLQAMMVKLNFRIEQLLDKAVEIGNLKNRIYQSAQKMIIDSSLKNLVDRLEDTCEGMINEFLKNEKLVGMFLTDCSKYLQTLKEKETWIFQITLRIIVAVVSTLDSESSIKEDTKITIDGLYREVCSVHFVIEEITEEIKQKMAKYRLLNPEICEKIEKQFQKLKYNSILLERMTKGAQKRLLELTLIVTPPSFRDILEDLIHDVEEMSPYANDEIRIPEDPGMLKSFAEALQFSEKKICAGRKRLINAAYDSYSAVSSLTFLRNLETCENDLLLQFKLPETFDSKLDEIPRVLSIMKNSEEKIQALLSTVENMVTDHDLIDDPKTPLLKTLEQQKMIVGDGAEEIKTSDLTSDKAEVSKIEKTMLAVEDKNENVETVNVEPNVPVIKSDEVTQRNSELQELENVGSELAPKLSSASITLPSTTTATFTTASSASAPSS